MKWGKVYLIFLTSIILFYLSSFSFIESIAVAQSATPTGQYAYVPNENSNMVSVIDTATNIVKVTVPVKNDPCGVAITPDGTKVYITNFKSDTVSVIDTATNKVTATVEVGLQPFGVAVTPDGTKAYVANYGSNTTSVINIVTNDVIATLPVGSHPYGVAVTPNGAKAYVTNRDDSSIISVIDTATNTIVNTVNVGSYPYEVAVAPDGTKVYVTNWQSKNVSIIDTATNTVTFTVNVGSEPHGIAMSPDGTKVYVANHEKSSGTVSVIDTATNMVTATVNVESYPTGVAVTPDGTNAYVTNYGSDSVSVIDTATNTVIATVNVGDGPSALGQFIGSIPMFTVETKTVLASPTNQYSVEKPIMLIATVSSTSQGIEKPSGTITFMDGNKVIGTENIISGQASLNISSLSAGSHSITAQYNGDSKFKPSISSVFTLSPEENTTNTGNTSILQPSASVLNTTTALTSSANQYSVGKQITLIATVGTSSQVTEKPTGTVTFMDETTVIATENVISGQATLNISSLSVGPHSIIAQYNSDSKFKPSISSAFKLTVQEQFISEPSMLDTTTDLTSSTNPSPFGQSITLTATVNTISQGTEKPSGTVTFMDETTVIGTEDVTSGRATITTSSFSVGPHSITAKYNGDNTFKSSTSSAFKIEIIENRPKNVKYVIIIVTVVILFAGIVLITERKTDKPSKSSRTLKLILKHPLISGLIATVIGGAILKLLELA